MAWRAASPPPGPRPQPEASRASEGASRGPQRVLGLLMLGLLAALLGGAFVSVAPNRLLTGQGLQLVSLWAADSASRPAAGWLGLLVPAGVLVAAVFGPPQRWLHAATALAAAALLCGLLALAGDQAAQREAGLSTLARVSPGAGLWLALLLLWLALGDGLQRLRLRPVGQTLAHALLLIPLLLLGASGRLDALSLAKEYANRQDVFNAAALRHLQIVGLTLLPALLIGLPLGVAAARSARLARPLFALLNLVQTVPSIALFGLLIAPLGWLAVQWPASGIRGIGLWPAVITLTLYALLPTVHGLCAGLQQVPAAVLDAATGMGMGPRQRFWRVALPLALPVLLSGLRVTTVQVVGLAVVAALIGAGGFGALVFQGLLSSALDLVLLGVLPVVALALLADAGFVLLAGLLPGPPALPHNP